MRGKAGLGLFAVLVAFWLTPNLLADDATPQNSLGRTIADFKLKDHLGTAHRLTEWSKRQAVVIVFLGTSVQWPS